MEIRPSRALRPFGCRPGGVARLLSDRNLAGDRPPLEGADDRADGNRGRLPFGRVGGRPKPSGGTLVRRGGRRNPRLRGYDSPSSSRDRDGAGQLCRDQHGRNFHPPPGSDPAGVARDGNRPADLIQRRPGRSAPGRLRQEPVCRDHRSSPSDQVGRGVEPGAGGGFRRSASGSCYRPMRHRQPREGCRWPGRAGRQHHVRTR